MKGIYVIFLLNKKGFCIDVLKKMFWFMYNLKKYLEVIMGLFLNVYYEIFLL